VRPPINRESDWLNHRIDYGPLPGPVVRNLIVPSYAPALPAVRSVDVRVHDRQHRVDVRFSRMTRMLAFSVRLMRNSLDAMVTMPGVGLFAQRINAPSGIGECGEREGRRGG
jgi:hypothetical protein